MSGITLLELSTDVLHVIYTLLTLDDVSILRRVCKKLHQISLDKNLRLQLINRM